jgi:hypothetical protein
LEGRQHPLDRALVLTRRAQARQHQHPPDNQIMESKNPSGSCHVRRE